MDVGDVIACPKCKGTKKAAGAPCRFCEGKGGLKMILCPDCGGRGWVGGIARLPGYEGGWIEEPDPCRGCSTRGVILILWARKPAKPEK